jgi:hypothetical protein
MGVSQADLTSRLDRSLLSFELLESIAHNLGVDPELFREYRLGFIAEWLLNQPGVADRMFLELCVASELESYTRWTPTPVPDPRGADARDMLKGLLDIVESEGPILTAYMSEVYLKAASLSPTSRLATLLARGIHALTLAGRTIDCGDIVPVARTPEQPPVRIRALGPRSIDQVPPMELEAMIRSTAAWVRGDSVGGIQQAVLARYGVERISLDAATHLNRCISRTGKDRTA